MCDATAWQHPVRLGEADLEQIRSLHDHLHDLMPQPGMFARETPAFFAEHLSSHGKIFGVRREGRLLAYGVLGLPLPGAAYNFGAWAGLEPALCSQVAQVDGVGVDPAFRGRGFQRRLISCRLRAAALAGRRFIYSTAAPDNRVSVSNLLDSGFIVVSLQKLFGGHNRYILMHAPSAALRCQPIRLVAAADLDTQLALLSAGLVGVQQGDTSLMGFAPAPATQGAMA
jgi:ribosomal protein S18 acetylase RimI-like enzyme